MAVEEGFKILGSHVKRQLLKFYRSKTLPGSIKISDKRFENLKIIKDNYKPGMTKAGSVSLMGMCNGQRAKIYSTRTPSQSELIKEVSDRLQQFSICLPKIIAIDGRYIAEEWVEGTIGTKIDVNKLSASVEGLLEKFKTDFVDLNKEKRFESAFDYFEDYLLKRIEPWLGYCDILRIKEDWFSSFLKAKTHLSISLSHPDLTASNVIFSEDGKIKVIDNELVGIGLGWILDIYNSKLNIKNSHKLTQFEISFRDRSIFLREIGSALDRGKFTMVERLADEYKNKFL